MRTEPGPLTTPCLACGGRVDAVAIGGWFLPKCSACGLSPAEAYFRAQQPRRKRVVIGPNGREIITEAQP